MSFKTKIGMARVLTRRNLRSDGASPSFAAPSYAVWVGGKLLCLYDRIVIRRWK